MKFAIRSAPNTDPATASARARELGYDGIELAGAAAEKPEGLEVSCLATALAYVRADADALTDQLKRAIDAAAKLGCPNVSLHDARAKGGANLQNLAVEFGQWLIPLGDYAAERNVKLLIENVLTFRRARQLWSVLEQANHPAIAAAWNVLDAALVGEKPAVSVPVLNTRIAYAIVGDARIEGPRATPSKLGEGDVAVRNYVTRLRGIGYDGWVTVASDSEELLKDAIAKLRDWTKKLSISDAQAAAEAAGLMMKPPPKPAPKPTVGGKPVSPNPAAPEAAAKAAPQKPATGPDAEPVPRA